MITRAKTRTQEAAVPILGLIAAFILWISLALQSQFNFYSSLSSEIIALAWIDLFLSVIAVSFSAVYFRRSHSCQNIFSDFGYKYAIDSLIFLWCMLSIFTVYSASSRAVELLHGMRKEILMEEFGKSRAMMFLAPLYSILLPFSIALRCEMKVVCIIFAGFIGGMVYAASRAELLFALYLALVFMLFLNRPIIYYVKFFLYGIIGMTAAGAMTILQGRADMINSAIFNASEAFIKYKIFSLYLSEIAIDRISKPEAPWLLYPFFGFIGERFVSMFGVIDHPISVQGSSFVYDFHSFGPDFSLSANVLYPWWAWFYGAFGIVGLPIKAIFTGVILVGLAKMNLPLCFMVGVYVVIFSSSTIHPLLNNDSVYFLMSAVVLEAILLYRIKPALLCKQ